MIFSNQNNDLKKIDEILGKRFKLKLGNLKTVGSPGLFLKDFFCGENNVSLKINSKCNFERRPLGMVMYLNYSNKKELIAFKREEFINIKLIEGTETISPKKFTVFWLLLKFNLNLKYAKYFAKFHEYYRTEMELIIKTKKYRFKFICNRDLFKRHLKFFKSLNLKESLLEIKTPKPDFKKTD